MSERTQPLARAAALASSLALAFAAASALDLAPWLRGPAPYPPEWQWEHRVPLAAVPPAAALAVLLVLLLIAASASAAVRRRERTAARLLVLAAVIVGFALPLALLAREPNGALRTLLARTTSFSTTSYHTAALSDEARDPLALVRRHAELLRGFARDAKHAATHPVGPLLLFRAANAASEASPRLTDALLGFAGVPERDFAPPLTRPARAGALLGALALSLLAAATAWPLAALARALGSTPLASARAALLWSLLPGPALIAPRFDAALALPVTAYALLVLRAARGERTLARAGSAGVCGAVALLLSYGAAAFLAIAGLAAAAAAALPSAASRAGALRRAAGALALSAVVALAVAFGLPAALGGHPVDALRTALAIHHEEYTAPRSYALWLLFDPIDFAAFCGVAPAALALASARSAARALLARRAVPPASLFALAVAVALALLVASGTTRGEVGRLWIPLMPLVLLSGLAASGTEEEARPGRVDTAQGRSAAGAVTVVAAATAAVLLAIASAWRI